MSIADNIDEVKYRIDKAARKSGRTAEDINLVAVSKTIEVPFIQEAVDYGITDFGENRPHEIRDKSKIIKGVNWHQIGQLQSNKIKYVAGKTKLIHSVDSEKLLLEIEKYCEIHNITQDVLLQLNISHEETKSGICSRDELWKILESAEKLSFVKVKGLMTIGSLYADSDENKKLFEICNNLFVDISVKKYDNISMKYLSMGMSGDFETAIEMGSNMVRIGTSIFGKRNYNA
ncbi:MAG: YggS family pyridoxal phosphate-dependent enzyme [Clostridia bacterium]|nr:YggS family pyridoxal phosphate-dependent enzyme [Clostridia bacterium]